MEKVEYYMIEPNLKQIYGKKVNKDTKFEEKTEDGRVHQIFKNLTLTTIINDEQEQGKYKIKEHSEVSVQVPEDTVLIWSEVEGFIIPQVSVCTLEELKEKIEDFREIYNQEEVQNDTKSNEGASI